VAVESLGEAGLGEFFKPPIFRSKSHCRKFTKIAKQLQSVGRKKTQKLML
jgi:hypothetical protein